MSSDRPPWWPLPPGQGQDDELSTACITAAQDALPNEVCGLIVGPLPETPNHTGLSLVLLEGTATPSSVTASPGAVVRFAYWMKQEDQRVYATFHSHPGGQGAFSQTDESLRLWAKDHVVAVLTSFGWKLMFA